MRWRRRLLRRGSRLCVCVNVGTMGVGGLVVCWGWLCWGQMMDGGRRDCSLYAIVLSAQNLQKASRPLALQHGTKNAKNLPDLRDMVASYLVQVAPGSRYRLSSVVEG
jgi:hypothetical protein